MIRLAVLMALALSVAGCGPDLSALANDPAPICLNITTIYGSFVINRYHGCDPMTAPAAKAPP